MLWNTHSSIGRAGVLSGGTKRAFSLLELMAVVAVMATMMGLAIPAMNNINNAQGITKTTYDIAGLFDQARTFAMANNTYVFVGLAEVDASVSPSQIPQVTTSANPYGRVLIAAVASRDGTLNSNASNLVAIDKLQRFESVHLANWSSAPPTTGAMARPAVPDEYNIGNTNCPSPLSSTSGWPQGTPLTSKVIQFDPQGVARVQSGNNADTIPAQIEVALDQTRGNVLLPAPVDQNIGNHAAIQINAVTGSTHVYRP